MDGTVETLARLRRLSQAVAPKIVPVDLAIPAVRELFRAAGVQFKLVGGIAVVHHGYARTTDDIDVLIESGKEAILDQRLHAYGFRRDSRTRLVHTATSVCVDLLLAGDPIPRASGAQYPDPGTVEASPTDPEIVGLAPLVQLKLQARRRQDEADIVELLKALDDSQYLGLESSVSAPLRSQLALLRRDALEELSWSR